MEENKKTTQNTEIEIESKITTEPKEGISEEEIDAIVEAAEDATPDEVINMRESISDTSEIESEGEEDGYVEEIKNIGLQSSYAELIGKPELDKIAASGSIYNVASPDYKPNDEDVRNKIIENTDILDLDNEEAINFADILMRYRNKEEIKGIYSKMPSKIRTIIANMASRQGVPPTEYNNLTKLFMDEFISNAELDEVFIDLEKSLDEALQIPTIIDMYSEHTRVVMEEKIPEIIEKIKDTEPENAQTLRDIQEAFKKAYKLEFLKDHYKADHRTRSDMREKIANPFSYCEQFNMINAKSRFKIPDCMGICPALSKALIKDAEGSTVKEGSRPDLINVTANDVSKFIILFSRSFKFFDAQDLVEAAQMYYSVKNLIVLGRAGEAKTDFAVELINNICDIIEFIREQEAAYATRMQNRKKNKKRK